MIPEPGDQNRKVPIPETFHEQTDDEPTEAEIKQLKADDQAIQIILLGLPKDIYAAVDTRAEGNTIRNNSNQIRCCNCRGLGIQLQAEEFDLMAAAANLDKIKEVNANCTLMANL
uniref:Uncharacterized protein n=1 Tax=Tanacetum cinerariifolium TaxID=118510 RepID=A0A699GVV6_TANCI|nr:hypothetical protein [Tanacetum cinerariifolium]